MRVLDHLLLCRPLLDVLAVSFQQKVSSRVRSCYACEQQHRAPGTLACAEHPGLTVLHIATSLHVVKYMSSRCDARHLCSHTCTLQKYVCQTHVVTCCLLLQFSSQLRQVLDRSLALRERVLQQHKHIITRRVSACRCVLKLHMTTTSSFLLCTSCCHQQHSPQDGFELLQRC